MICVIALVVFGILGVFSAKYRIIAKEAFDCVFRRITLRKCESGLDKRLKSQITGKLMKRAPKIAKFTFKNFEIISWFFTILMLASIVQSGISVYNYIEYGNCNGPTKEGFCIFDPLAKEEVSACGADGKAISKTLIAPENTIGFNSFGNKNSKVKLVMFGCYTCPYTKQSAQAVFNTFEKYKDRVEFVFIDFPIPTHNNSFLAAEASQCVYAQNPELFIEYSKRLYDEKEITENSLANHAQEVGADVTQFNLCLTNHTYKADVEKSILFGKTVGVYGTPTFFINKVHVVGPTTEKSFDKLIDDELKK